MTTIDLYKKHKAGEVSREKFLYEVRRDTQLPWIISVTSYDDAIKILKNKGIIRESIEETKAEEAPMEEMSHEESPIEEKEQRPIDKEIIYYVTELGDNPTKRELGTYFGENNLLKGEETALLFYYGYNKYKDISEILDWKERSKERRRAFAENKENIPVSKEQKIQVIKEWIWYCFEEGTDKESIQKWNKKIDNY